MVCKGLPLKKERKWNSFAGYASTYEFRVHNTSLVNVVRGLTERVFCVERDGKLQRPLRPREGVYEAVLGDIGRKIGDLVGYCPSYTRCEFVGTYGGMRRATYEKARLSLDVLPLTRRDAYLKTFVKAEKINVTLKPDPAPRVIQPRDPRYNVEVGRYLKKLEPRLMKAIDKLWGHTTAIKGYTVERVGAIIHEKSLRFRDCAFVGLDASRFDQHCSVQALEWEHSVYNRIFKDPYLKELLTWQLLNTGSAYLPDGFIRYKVEGCRMSGDMNTSMGNYLIMSCLCYAYCKSIGVRAELVNCGDDCVLFLERSDLPKLKSLPDWFAKMGYAMKVEKAVFSVEQVEFC